MDKNRLLMWIARQPQESRMACRQLLDTLQRVERSGESACTLFLSPEVAELIPSMGAHFPRLHLMLLPEDCERKVLCVVDENTEAAFPDITVLEIMSQDPLRHADILGAVLGTGITRDRMGDIRIKDTCAEVMVKKSVSEFLCDTLTHVGRFPIRIRDKKSLEFSIPEKEGVILRIIVSGIRLDAVVAALTRLSREKAQNKIKKGEVKYNHRIIYQPSQSLSPGDILSLRGYGRFLLCKEEGTTKKGNKVLLIEHKQ